VEDVKRDSSTTSDGSKVQELLSRLSGTQPVKKVADDRLRNADAAKREIENKGKEEYYELRKQWSIYIMFVLPPVIVFQAVLIAMVGLAKWPFTGNSVFVNTVAGELFLQIAGMGYIIVRCLFPPGDTDAKRSSARSKAKSAEGAGK